MNSQLERSPLRILIGYRYDTCEPNEPETHSILPPSATVGRISDDAVFYLMSRGIPEDDARAMIVSGFADNVSKELPLEYAMEMNNLIKLEMKGSIG